MTANVSVSRRRTFRILRKVAKRVAVLAAAITFIPYSFAAYVVLGLLDFARNKSRKFSSLDRYFAGNGIITWLLCPINLLIDLLSLPYWNKGVYELSDLPASHRDEIRAIMEAAHKSDLVGTLAAKMDAVKRGMIFFKWYGRNVRTSIDVPEFHREYRHIRTIGVSIFNKRQSTGKHFGPLRITLRVLYNINRIDSDKVYIKVGNRVNYWRDNRLFIFDDTLQHQSCNQSDDVRYCMFVDILRPSLVPGLLGALLACVRVAGSPFNAAFYKHWSFIR